eukprot:TRINITY_DN6023_c0_g1_i8.p1 TRINITY_DN6023_c0_g1~~TRINITY_DN6023_c0_g1_i8.p1  ORF type:complete len:246 (-),score=62.44 TRINITY_DN6023_c0_g1_i8:123-860(-)
MCIRDRYMGLMEVRDEGYRVSLENEEVNEELQTFLLNVFTLMELLDSAGCTLDDVFGSKSNSQAEFFKMFLINLEIWGSSLPIKVCLKTEASNEDFNHRLALFKLGEFIRKIEAFVALERRNNPSELNRKVLDDLEIVSKKFRIVRERINSNLALKARSRHIRRFGGSAMSERIVSLENQSLTEKRILIDNSTSESRIEHTGLSLEEIRRQVGYLLPLSCGHNGNLNRIESQVFEKHLRAIEFIK